jgi:O-antigen ligase
VTPVPREDPSAARLRPALEGAAATWLVVLPLLRPLVWSGEPTDLPNLFVLVLLGAAIATGLLLRAVDGDQARGRPGLLAALGALVLLATALGAWQSPLPARAWALTCGWTLHLGAAWALWPALRRWPGLALGGLLAGLVGELALIAGQALWERPAIQRALAADPALVPDARMAEQMHVRAWSWRLEGSFLLANTLAAYLVMMVPLACGSALAAWRERTALRWPLALLGVAALVALAATGSKAGMLALVVAGAGTAVVAAAQRRLRWLALAAAACVVVAALAVPAVRARALASADVRLDYWSAALALIGERPLAGHGLEGFSANYLRVKAPGGEETILAHQETLQAAVDLGLPAAALLVAWLVALLWRVRPGPPAATIAVAPVRRAAIPLAGILLAFALLAVGAQRSALMSYAGGAEHWWGWALGLTALATTAAWFLRRAPLPSPAWWFAAVAACLLHAQADFHLHSMQVVGILALLSVTALARREDPPSAPAQPVARGRQLGFALAGLAVLATVLAGVVRSAERHELLQRGHEVAGLLARWRAPGQQPEQLEGAFARAVSWAAYERRGLAVPDDPLVMMAVVAVARLAEESSRFPADPDLSLTATEIAAGIQSLAAEQAAPALTAWLERLAGEWPERLATTKALADHYRLLARQARERQRADAPMLTRRAQAWAMRVVERHPTYLPFREELVELARLTGDRETEQAQIAELRRLAPLVHVTGRATKPW